MGCGRGELAKVNKIYLLTRSHWGIRFSEFPGHSVDSFRQHQQNGVPRLNWLMGLISTGSQGSTSWNGPLKLAGHSRALIRNRPHSDIFLRRRPPAEALASSTNRTAPSVVINNGQAWFSAKANESTFTQRTHTGRRETHFVARDTAVGDSPRPSRPLTIASAPPYSHSTTSSPAHLPARGKDPHPTRLARAATIGTFRDSERSSRNPLRRTTHQSTEHTHPMITLPRTTEHPNPSTK